MQAVHSLQCADYIACGLLPNHQTITPPPPRLASMPFSSSTAMLSFNCALTIQSQAVQPWIRVQGV